MYMLLCVCGLMVAGLKCDTFLAVQVLAEEGGVAYLDRASKGITSSFLLRGGDMSFARPRSSNSVYLSSPL